MIEEKEGLLCMTMYLFSVRVDRENQVIGEGPELVERVKTGIMYDLLASCRDWEEPRHAKGNLTPPLPPTPRTHAEW